MSRQIATGAALEERLAALEREVRDLREQVRGLIIALIQGTKDDTRSAQ